MQSAEQIYEKIGLGPIDQISYAVRNLEQALPRFTALFGPFHALRTEVNDLTFRGRTSKAVLNIAFGRSGPLEIELVEVVSGDFPQGEFLARHGEGLHHVRYLVQDMDAKITALKSEGFTEVVVGGSGPVRFAYLEAPAFLGDSMIELFQPS